VGGCLRPERALLDGTLEEMGKLDGFRATQGGGAGFQKILASHRGGRRFFKKLGIHEKGAPWLGSGDGVSVMEIPHWGRGRGWKGIRFQRGFRRHDF